MIDSKAKDAFWSAVEDCLVEIHGLARPDAHNRSMDLRARIESPPTGMSSESFYHSEPFDVACDIAGKYPPLSQYRPLYDRILDHYNW